MSAPATCHHFTGTASVAGLGGAIEDGGYLVNAVEVPRGDVHHQVIGGVVSERQAALSFFAEGTVG